MKKMWGTRVLAMLLVLALTAGLVPAALAANSEVSVAFKQVPNDTLDTLIRPDLAVGEIENAEMGEDTAAYQAHDLVRVSIILEDASTLEAYSDAAAEGTLAEDAAAVSYRAALQRKQDSVVRKISSTILGREDLDVVWNLTLVANMISANVEYGKIEQIKQLPGVADVVLEQQYEPCRVRKHRAAQHGDLNRHDRHDHGMVYRLYRGRNADRHYRYGLGYVAPVV